MLSLLKLTNVTPGDRREPPADTKCPPAAQRKKAKRLCILIYLTYDKSPKNDDSSPCYDVIITHQNFIIDKFGDFLCDIDYNSCTGVFRNVISFNQCDPGALWATPVDQKCPPAAQRKQAKRLVGS